MGLYTMTARKGKYIPVNVYIYMKDTFIKNWQSKSVLRFNSSEGITNFTNRDISDSNMRCGVCIKELWDYMSRKVDLLKQLHSLLKALNKSYKVPREEKYGVCKKIITKLTDYYFTIIELGTTSFGNYPSFTQQKEKFPLIKCSGPMCIDFYEYPRYSGRNSKKIEKYVNESIKCDHGYAYSSGKHNMCTWVNE